jgi:enoyl-[acyl-carrier protein] reductase II
MVSAAESPIHDNWKRLIVDSGESDTLLLNQDRPPALRVLRTPTSEAMFRGERPATLADRNAVLDLYFGGNLDAAFALGGQVAGRIESVEPVAKILEETMRDCEAILADPLRLGTREL